MKDLIRLGRISSINYEEGTAKVVYRDRENDVTDDLPYFSFNGEYKMPKINDMTLVIHLSNGTTAGIIMGGFWRESNKPNKGKKGMFIKELSNIPSKATITHNDATGITKIYSEHIELDSYGDGKITVAEIIEMKKKLDKLV